ncbi:unnamed protein product [Ixodes pacificus]
MNLNLSDTRVFYEQLKELLDTCILVIYLVLVVEVFSSKAGNQPLLYCLHIFERQFQKQLAHGMSERSDVSALIARNNTILLKSITAKHLPICRAAFKTKNVKKTRRKLFFCTIYRWVVPKSPQQKKPYRIVLHAEWYRP